MVSIRILVLIGAVLGVIPIALGIVALVTTEWITSSSGLTSSVVICSLPSLCLPASEATLTKSLEIAGVVAIGVGVILSVILGMWTKNLLLLLLPQIFLIAGPILILIGFLLYAKYLFEMIITVPLDLGYSFLLMIIACIVGFITAVYFAFVAGSSSPQSENCSDNDSYNSCDSKRVSVVYSQRF
ncbi:unnamed protein product [Rotaria magnacalcarata]|uniref:Uncharacterized protein n=1 Tax=Rotaria magnacalcarata TaxID=392030 RepID=A0A816NEA7_9BILA|nr:unnamed protein product [Rotaria magnacalcarata]CAF2034678.1 unnamed protein product [Rotaria magnacalcarata]CAF3814320.1 unnamed protein product [Rotaria magnacalcarata]CAF3857813.1 unnamed protein product [Rotaria magnacalcarata]